MNLSPAAWLKHYEALSHERPISNLERLAAHIIRQQLEQDKQNGEAQ